MKLTVDLVASLPIERLLVKPVQVEPKPERIAIVGGGRGIGRQVAQLTQETKKPEQPISDYSGVSQMSAAGKACIPCGTDHFSTAAGLLNEAKRFALEGGIEHPEVLDRIARAEDELNAFERVDGALDKVATLPPDEKALMDRMLIASRKIRHELKEISDTEALDKVGAEAMNARRDFRLEVFKRQFTSLSEAKKEELRKRARDLVRIDEL